MSEQESASANPQPDRRRFLAWLSAGLSALIGVILSMPAIGFLISPLLSSPRAAWRRVGRVASFATGQTVKVTFLDASPEPWAGYAAKTAAWLSRVDAHTFKAYSIDCTHLGCPVDWLPQATLFMCPCHGGVFYKDGQVAAGPPPRPLQQYPVRLRLGYVEILTSPLPISTSIGQGT